MMRYREKENPCMGRDGFGLSLKRGDIMAQYPHYQDSPLKGQMMSDPLLISSINQHADRYFGGNEIVSRRVEGDIHRYTYRDCHRRARRLADALRNLGVQPGERVATLAWNGYRHLDAYYAVSGSGAVLHTINPRLHPDQIAYIANHADCFLYTSDAADDMLCVVFCG